jgi:hypothetical protein
MIKHNSTIWGNTWVGGFLNTEITVINILKSQITFVVCQIRSSLTTSKNGLKRLNIHLGNDKDLTSIWMV